MRYVNLMLLSVMFFIIPTEGFAGSLNDPGAPDNDASAMYTVTDVYNRINDGTPGTTRTTFREPIDPPGPTGKTLNDLYNIASERSRPAKTGQTTSYATGDDGDLEKGVSWPSTRFTDNGNGTVTDNLTGLMWLKNANNAGSTKTWADSLTYCNDLVDSGYSDWRLPNLKELQSLIDYGQSFPPLPSGHPFTDVQLHNYWSSTTNDSTNDQAWKAHLMVGLISTGDKTEACYVWPVRGGQ